MRRAPSSERPARPRRGARVFWLILGGLILAVLAWAAWRWSVRSGEVTVVDPAVSDTVGTGFRSVRLWFVARSGEALVSEPREVIEQAGLHERVAALLDEWEGAAEADDVFSGKKVCAVLLRALEG